MPATFVNGDGVLVTTYQCSCCRTMYEDSLGGTPSLDAHTVEQCRAKMADLDKQLARFQRDVENRKRRFAEHWNEPL